MLVIAFFLPLSRASPELALQVQTEMEKGGGERLSGEQGEDNREGMYDSDEINGDAACIIDSFNRGIDNKICSNSAHCRHQNAELFLHIYVGWYRDSLVERLHDPTIWQQGIPS